MPVIHLQSTFCWSKDLLVYVVRAEEHTFAT